MELTYLGYVLIPIGLFIALVAPRLLVHLFVFFVPFSASAVVNFPGVGFGLQPSHFFAALWIFRTSVSWLKKGAFPFPHEARRSLWLFLVFLGVVSSSLLMPLSIDGQIEALGSGGGEGSAPVRLRWTNVTQLTFLLYALVITFFLAAEVSSRRSYAWAVRTYVLSAVFVSFWGCGQAALYYLGLPYPAEAFNNSMSSSALGYVQEFLDLRVKRVTSVAVEPSILAQVLIIALAFLSSVWLHKGKLFPARLWDRAALIVITAALLLSTSTSAYVGILALLTLLALSTSSNLGRIRILALGTTVGLALLVAAWKFPRFADVLASVTVGKFQTFSGQSRLVTNLQALRLFAEYPLLGVGWGSATAHGLIAKLLSNAGILGFTLFMVFLGSVFGRLRHMRRVFGPDDESGLRTGLMITLGLLVLLNVLTGFSFVFGHLWFIIGLAIGAPAVAGVRRRVRAVQPALLADRG